MSSVDWDDIINGLPEAVEGNYNPKATFTMDGKIYAHLKFLCYHGKYSKRKRQYKKNMNKCTRMFEELYG